MRLFFGVEQFNVICISLALMYLSNPLANLGSMYCLITIFTHPQIFMIDYSLTCSLSETRIIFKVISFLTELTVHVLALFQ